MQIYAERAAFCKQRPTISQCQTHARNPIQLKRLNAAFEKQEHTIRARRRALAHEKNAVRNTLTQLLTNDVKAVAPVRRSALEQSLRPSDSRPRVYVYNISRIFNDINLTRAQILAYDSLLRNDALQHLPWGSKLQHMRLGVSCTHKGAPRLSLAVGFGSGRHKHLGYVTVHGRWRDRGSLWSVLVPSTHPTGKGQTRGGASRRRWHGGTVQGGGEEIRNPRPEICTVLSWCA